MCGGETLCFVSLVGCVSGQVWWGVWLYATAIAGAVAVCMRLRAEVQVILGTTPRARLPKPGTRLRSSLMSSNKVHLFPDSWYVTYVRLSANRKYATVDFH
jgi:hypothetical protein